MASAPEASAPQEAPPQEAPPQEKDEPGALEKVLSSAPVKSFLRSAASAIGREITRGLFGTAKRRR